MRAEQPACVGCCEDSHELFVLRHQCASDVVCGHVVEHRVEWLTLVHHIHVGQEHVADEQFLFRRQPEVRVQGALEVSVCQDAHKHAMILDRQVTDPMLDHQRSGAENAVTDLHEVREGRHH